MTRSPDRSRRRQALLVLTACAALSTSVIAGCSDDSTTEPEAVSGSVPGERPRIGAAPGVSEATYTFVIPLDTGAMMADGVVVDILPGSLLAKVGETIRIVNDDRQGHVVGPWYVGPNETLTQKFTSPGIYEGECTVHSSGAFILNVSA